MAKVLAVGGVFFKSPDPEKLYAWYERWLGIKADVQTGIIFQPQNMPKNGATVWSAFDSKTTYFEPSDQEYMFNLMVDNLDEALAQVHKGGAQVVGKEAYDYGKFGWFIDPDGRKVELWEPAP